jgi:hypothetical protein
MTGDWVQSANSRMSDVELFQASETAPITTKGRIYLPRAAAISLAVPFTIEICGVVSS